MSKPGAVCKDVLSCFHLALATQTLGALYREKALSILPNGSMVKDGSSRPGTSCDRLAKVSEPTTTLGVAGLEGFAVLASQSQEMAPLDCRTIEGSSPSI